MPAVERRHQELQATQSIALRPNIIFLFADDQQVDSIGAWGNPHIEAPNLDRLETRPLATGLDSP